MSELVKMTFVPHPNYSRALGMLYELYFHFLAFYASNQDSGPSPSDPPRKTGILDILNSLRSTQKTYKRHQSPGAQPLASPFDDKFCPPQLGQGISKPFLLTDGREKSEANIEISAYS